MAAMARGTCGPNSRGTDVSIVIYTIETEGYVSVVVTSGLA